jgi:hypothetical protein
LVIWDTPWSSTDQRVPAGSPTSEKVTGYRVGVPLTKEMFTSVGAPGIFTLPDDGLARYPRGAETVYGKVPFGRGTTKLVPDTGKDVPPKLSPHTVPLGRPFSRNVAAYRVGTIGVNVTERD